MMRPGDKLASYRPPGRGACRLIGPALDDWTSSARACPRRGRALFAPFGDQRRLAWATSRSARLGRSIASSTSSSGRGERGLRHGLLEAQAFGCPGRRGAHGGVASACWHGETGLLACPTTQPPSRRPRGLSSAIRRAGALGAGEPRFVVEERGVSGRPRAAESAFALRRSSTPDAAGSESPASSPSPICSAPVISTSRRGRARLRAAGHEVTLSPAACRTASAPCGSVRSFSCRRSGPRHGLQHVPSTRPASRSHPYAEMRRQRLARRRQTRPQCSITELFPFGRRALAGEFLDLVEEATGSRLARSSPPRCATSSSRLEGGAASPRRPGDRPRLLRRRARTRRPRRSYPSTHPGPRRRGCADCAIPATSTRGAAAPNGGRRARSSYRAAPARREPSLHGRRSAPLAPVPERPWRILVGGESPRPSSPPLVTAAGPMRWWSGRGDFRDLARAAASVSQAGYNTAVDLLRTGPSGRLVPFEAGNETEQRLRAERLAVASGTPSCSPRRNLRPAPSRRRRRPAGPAPHPAAIRLDGAERSVAIVEELADGRQTAPRRCRKRALAASRRSLEAPRGTRAAPLPVLVARRRCRRPHPGSGPAARAGARFDPCARSAVPPRPSRPCRPPRGEPQAASLVHGLAHLNHAPPGPRRPSSAPHRPPVRWTTMRTALSLARDRFGACSCRSSCHPGTGSRRSSSRPVRARLPRPVRLRAAGGPRAAPASCRSTPMSTRSTGTGRAGCGRRTAIIADLRARSGGADGGADPDEPIGLLTHHLVHDEAMWAFCETLLERLRSHDNPLSVAARRCFPRSRHRQDRRLRYR